ncbi:hypothetical protein A33M_1668 [Rhodovulum sp. PH10]|nr:hypothetical protein A33M_1668 [Rhodovulum sp. PH10]
MIVVERRRPPAAADAREPVSPTREAGFFVPRRLPAVVTAGPARTACKCSTAARRRDTGRVWFSAGVVRPGLKGNTVRRRETAMPWLPPQL